MKAPDKIYLNTPKIQPELDNTTWDTRPYDDCINVEYIRKNALLEWAKEKYEDYDRRLVGFPDDGAYWGQRNAFRQMIDKLNSM